MIFRRRTALVSACVAIFVFFSPFAGEGRAASSSRPPVIEKTRVKAETIAGEISADIPEKLETAIRNYFGLRYRMGGEGKNGIDCSALVKKVYADAFNVELPRNSRQQSSLDGMEDVSEDALETGDLLFFGPKRSRITHVGIYLAGGYFLHAVRSEGVTISRLDGQYWKSRWMLAKRVKGLPLEYDEDRETALDGVLTRLSFNAALAGAPAEEFHFLEGGLKFNNWPELRLAGFFAPAVGEPAFDAGALPVSGEPEPEPYDLTGATTGWRFSTVFSPVAWEGLSLIPSVTQISSRDPDSDAAEAYQRLGLETRLTLPSTGISLFMGAHAQNRENLVDQPLRWSPDWRTLDLSFGLHFRLSDTINFSLSGTRACPLFDDEELLATEDRPFKDFSSSFNFQF
ncbi:MAG: C40 family peptidase [Thermodesulfobacteriota bacterium]